MQNYLKIPLVKQPLAATVRLPGSKSITNRALLLASLATGTSNLHGALDAVDVQVLVQALTQLGVSLNSIHQDGWRVVGTHGKFQPTEQQIYVNNAGTVARFLTPLLAFGVGDYTVDGNPRMRLRPMQTLLNAVQPLGLKIECTQQPGCLPFQVHAKPLLGGEVHLDGRQSSQFASALAIAAPLMPQGLKIQFTSPLVSKDYLNMTLKMMQAFKVQSTWLNESCLSIPYQQNYAATDYPIEADASSASYFLALAAITKSQLEILDTRSCWLDNPSLDLDQQTELLQPDFGFLHILEQMGCQARVEKDNLCLIGQNMHGLTLDMNRMSDVVPTLAVTALFANSPTRIVNVQHMRYKESDRLNALTQELLKVGADIQQQPDGLIIQPRPLNAYQGARLETYDDHRLAMAFALLGTCIQDIQIENPTCVNKTFPTFFEQLFKVIKASPNY